MFLNMLYFKYTNFLISQTIHIFVINQIGEKFCCNTSSHFKIPHNLSDRYHPPFSFIDCLDPLRNR